MKEILKKKTNNPGYRKIELVKKKVDSWDILIKINYIKMKRIITDIEEKIDNVNKNKNPRGISE